MYPQLTHRRKPELRNQPPFDFRHFSGFSIYSARQGFTRGSVLYQQPVSVPRLAKHLRGHWGIENSLHWSLDVTFGEHKS